VLENAAGAVCDPGGAGGGTAVVAARAVSGIGLVEGVAGKDCCGNGDGGAIRGGSATAGEGLGAKALGFTVGGRGFVSCVRNSDEIGSIGARGGIDCMGGSGVGGGSITGVGVHAGGATVAIGALEAVWTAGFSTPVTSCNVVPVG
jgi:hypothetical protein